MPKPNPYRPFIPKSEQMALWPDLSGNTVNGLGEEEPRRPKKVYWSTDPSDIAHGGLQNWFFTQGDQTERFSAERSKRQKILNASLPDVASKVVERESDAWTSELDRFVDEGVCEKIGVAQMDPMWVMDGMEVSYTRVIVAGVHHSFDEISKAPDAEAGLEVMRQYGRAAFAAKQIAGWLHSQGWKADPVTGPMTSAITLIPPALACGFGELGKHGSIINRDLGASFRLSAVLTDAPFSPTPVDVFGADEFCQNCRICEDACPPEALFPDKKLVRGETKWYVDFDRCLPFFNQTQGCAICIAVCPWSRPGVGPNLAVKLERRAERLRE